MRIGFALTTLVAACLGAALPLHAQTAVGTWQTTTPIGRSVTQITNGPHGKLHGEAYYPGTECFSTLNGHPISTIDVKGRHVRFTFDDLDLGFDGELSADGKALIGHSTGGGSSLPITFRRATAKTAWVIDPSPHKVLFVPVQKGVRLEVLDWGGHGPPLVLLTGNGHTAHTFDTFALNFTGTHHVYAITRRGFGVSSRPPPTDANYDSDRLGDDVLAVIDALKLDRPVIAGHSLAGEEMSSIGTRHPEKVSGLIYLDAGYDDAFYNPKGGNTQVDMSTVHRDLAALATGSPSQQKLLIQQLLGALPALEGDLRTLQKQVENWPDSPPASGQTQADQIEQVIWTNMRKYSGIRPPVLAIFASPHAGEAKANAALNSAQIDAFQVGTPQARVIRIADAEHEIYRSNEAQVVREMNAFMDGLH